MNVDYWLFDADNHYYEPRDCFTRHIEARFADKAVRPRIDDSGEEALYFGSDRLEMAPVKFDKTEPPGSLKDIMRNKELTSFKGARSKEHMLPAYQDRDARLALMDEQRVEATLMLPSLGVGWEHETLHDLPAHYANLRSFNRWLEEDWGFGTDGRIIGVPLISLFDLDEALAETDRLLDLGIKAIHLRPTHVAGRSPADPYFDPFWARIQEAGVIPAFHFSDSGYTDLSGLWGEERRPNARAMSAMQWGFFVGDRPIMDTLASLIYHNLFGRFPHLTVLSIENGSSWVPYFLKQLRKGAAMGRYGPWPGGELTEHPIEIFKRHVMLTPYHEDDVIGLVHLLGAKSVLLGSDFPHPEGTKTPIEFADLLEGLPEQDVRLVLRDNLRDLLAA